MNVLDNNELLSLRQVAEQIDTSGSPDITLSSRQSGRLPSRALGSGIDYAESRIYQPGDDTRSINWRLSARSHETFVKTFHIESKPAISIFLDRRRSMVFGTRKRLKITQAVRIACLLAYAAEYYQLGFQAWILDENGVQSFDYTENNTEAFIIQANQPCSMTTTDLKLGISAALQAKKFSPLVYLISDFSDLKETHKADLAKLNEQCFIQAIHIMDQAELELPKVGKLRFQDMHKDSNYQLDSSQTKDRKLFTKLARESFNQKKAVFDTLGISYKLLACDAEKIQDAVSLPLGNL